MSGEMKNDCCSLNFSETHPVIDKEPIVVIETPSTPNVVKKPLILN